MVGPGGDGRGREDAGRWRWGAVALALLGVCRRGTRPGISARPWMGRLRGDRGRGTGLRRGRAAPPDARRALSRHVDRAHPGAGPRPVHLGRRAHATRLTRGARPPRSASPGPRREDEFRSVHKMRRRGFRAPAADALADLMKTARARRTAGRPGGRAAAGRGRGARPEPVPSVLPDDARLGEFRADFAGTLGTSRRARTRRSTGAEVSPAPRRSSPRKSFSGSTEALRPGGRAGVPHRADGRRPGGRPRPDRDNWRWALMDADAPVRRWPSFARPRRGLREAQPRGARAAAPHQPQLVSFGPATTDAEPEPARARGLSLLSGHAGGAGLGLHRRVAAGPPQRRADRRGVRTRPGRDEG